MRVVGFDPSLTHAGVAVGEIDGEYNLQDIIHIETIITAKSKDKKIKRADDDFNRILKISLRFNEIIEEFKPEWGFCESTCGFCIRYCIRHDGHITLACRERVAT